jgi:hypothetical protein
MEPQVDLQMSQDVIGVDQPTATVGNPLVALAVAVIYAVLYVLNSIRAIVAWLTITLPR